MPRNWLFCSALLIGVFQTQFFANHVLASDHYCINTPKIPTQEPHRGVNFIPWTQLSRAQQILLSQEEYIQLTADEDGKAATFLAVTNALGRLRFSPDSSTEVSGMDIVLGIKEIRADRLIVYLDVAKVRTWINKTLKYSLIVGGQRDKTEWGKIKLYNHVTPSAGLHCGYDLQWYTKASKAPHLHWNMRLSDGLADVHLDGYSPWIDFIIPNFRHLTYANSDVRYWFSRYLKKYGGAGFKVINDALQE